MGALSIQNLCRKIAKAIINDPLDLVVGLVLHKLMAEEVQVQA